MGKCLLACLSGERLDDILEQCTFEQFTQNTCHNKRDFRQLLRRVRLQGWAMDDEEYQLGHRCIGAPIFDYRGDAVAAISASGTTSDINETTFERVRNEVIRTAKQISGRMGYTN